MLLVQNGIADHESVNLLLVQMVLPMSQILRNQANVVQLQKSLPIHTNVEIRLFVTMTMSVMLVKDVCVLTVLMNRILVIQIIVVAVLHEMLLVVLLVLHGILP